MSDTKVQDLSMYFIFFNFSFKKEAEIEILRDHKKEHAGETWRFVPVLVVKQSHPNNPYL